MSKWSFFWIRSQIFALPADRSVQTLNNLASAQGESTCFRLLHPTYHFLLLWHFLSVHLTQGLHAIRMPQFLTLETWMAPVDTPTGWMYGTASLLSDVVLTLHFQRQPCQPPQRYTARVSTNVLHEQRKSVSLTDSVPRWPCVPVRSTHSSACSFGVFTRWQPYLECIQETWARDFKVRCQEHLTSTFWA